MSIIKSVNDLPEVSFIGDINLEELRAQMISDYCTKYKELTGKPTVLPADDKNRILLGVCAMQIYQAFMYIEQTGKMNLIKYAAGSNLDNLGALRGVVRNENSKSKVTMRFERRDNFANELTIPRLTRVTTEDYEVFWVTPNIDVTMPAGQSYIDIDCTCTEDGSFSNGFEYGEIDRMVDNVAFVYQVYNINASSGGSDYESDDDLRLRILNAPSGYSSAGTADSYKYNIKQLDSQIVDVYVTNGENDGEVTAYIMVKSGVPSQDQVDAYQDLIDSSTFKPLTDKVTVEPAPYHPFGVDIIFYIARKDASKVTTIRMDVEKAVNEFINELECALGIPINPSSLIQKVMNAGACRVIINAPTYTAVPPSEFARKTYRVVTYGGLA